MLLSISDYTQFLDVINRFIIDTYSIYPRDFSLADDYTFRPLCYDINTQSLVASNCIQRNLHLHTLDSVLWFCSEPESIAALYINQAIYGDERTDLFLSLYDWLPVVTFGVVNVRFDQRQITSHLHPQYAYKFLTTQSTTFNKLYYYTPCIDSTLVLSSANKILNMAPAVRGRGRRRGSRKSRSPTRGSRRSRSASRKNSPRRSPSGGRRRSRSRSSSRRRSMTR